MLFIAAIVPGIILALAFALLILGMATWTSGDGSAMFRTRTIPSVRMTNPSRRLAMKLFPDPRPWSSLVIGGIYGGLFTPTEAGAAGSFGALVIGILKRKLDWKTLWSVLIETGHITVSILFLILGGEHVFADAGACPACRSRWAIL